MDIAHARASDPDTSHAAADAITPHLSELQRWIESYAFGKGTAGFCDAEMAYELDDPTSTLRSRRAELTEKLLIVDSGRRKRYGESERQRIVWVHRTFADSQPPDRHRQSKAEQRQSDARTIAAELESALRDGGVCGDAHRRAMTRAAEFLNTAFPHS